MYKLSFLKPDLSEWIILGFPCTHTLPDLVAFLAQEVLEAQSYGTILASINARGSYARAYTTPDGFPCIAVIAPVATEG
jgi:hypothetical protein